MLQALRRHPLPMRTRFGHSLVLTYALPPAVLEPLLPPGLTLDTYTTPGGETYGFVAVGIVSTLGLRPAGLPAAVGMDAVLTGYRIFATFPTPAGRTMRGLYILRSDTQRAVLAAVGNVLTRYRYHLARIRLTLDGAELTATVDSRDGGADLTVTADLASRPAPLPPGSPFAGGHTDQGRHHTDQAGHHTDHGGRHTDQARADMHHRGGDRDHAGTDIDRGGAGIGHGGVGSALSCAGAVDRQRGHGVGSARRGDSVRRGESARCVESVRDESTHDESARDESAHNESVRRDETVRRDEGVHDDSARCDESVRVESVRGVESQVGPAVTGSLNATVARHQKSIFEEATARSLRSFEAGERAARRFAGPLPYTFDHEPGSGSIVVVKAHRSAWVPEPVAVRVSRCTFLERGVFAGTRPVLAQAFHVADLDYGWHRGVRRDVWRDR